MASRLLSRAAFGDDAAARRENPARPDQSAAVFPRILAALARAHRQTIRFEIARHRRSDTRVSAELEHQLSRRFGIPVR